MAVAKVTLRYISARYVSALVFAIFAAASPLQASNWTIDGFALQGFEVDTNRDFSEDGAPVYGSVSELGMSVLLDQQNLQWQTDLGVAGLFFVGPGNTQGLRRADPVIASEIVYSMPRTIIEGGFSFEVEPSAFAQVEDTGITDESAAQLTTDVFASVTYLVDARNSASLEASGRLVRFTGEPVSLVPNSTYGLNGQWFHRVNARLGTNAQLGATRFTADDDENPDSVILDSLVGIEYAFNPRLSGETNVGVNVVRSRVTRGEKRETDLTVAFAGDASLVWSPDEATVVDVEISQAVQPNSLGELQNVSGVGFGVDHKFNERLNIEFESSYVRRAAISGFETEGTNRQLATFSPTLGYRFTPNWEGRVSYGLELNRFEGASLTPNQVVFVSISRSFNLLP